MAEGGGDRGTGGWRTSEKKRGRKGVAEGQGGREGVGEREEDRG